jgi:hypothetical protein
MCPCHDPLVFGHRCRNEPSGDYYTPSLGVQLAELDHRTAVMLEALGNILGDLKRAAA